MSYRVIASDGTYKTYTSGLFARDHYNRLSKAGHIAILERYDRITHGWVAV